MKIEPAWFVFCGLLIMTIPLDWLLSWFTAAIIHELFHICAIYLTGGNVERITIGAIGAKIQTSFSSWGREVFCAAAGNIGGITLLLFANRIPRIAVCAFVQTLFNFIPIRPFDGGRVLHGLLQLWFPKHADGVSRWTERIFLVLLCGFGVILALRFHLGLLPLIVPMAIVMRITRIKSSCKEVRLGVQ